MRIVRNCLFHLKVTAIKTLIVAFSLPVSLVCILWGMLRREHRLSDLVALFDPSEWARIVGEYVEALACCRWYIEAAKSRPLVLSPYCFWDEDSKLICCLHLEDAVLLNMKHGGTLTRHPNKSKNNARSVLAI